MKHSERRDIYAEISDRILTRIEETGTLPWTRPWDIDKCQGPSAPVNPTTGKHYHGLNAIFLSMHPRFFETSDPRFCTFLQAKEKGWNVIAGQKATPVIFFKPLKIEDSDATGSKNGERPSEKLIHLLRAYSVFHVGTQLSGAPAYDPPKADAVKWDRVEAPFTMLQNMGVSVVERGEKAFYSPAGDFIGMPPHHAFKSPESEAFVLLHEGSHATGHAKRMNRDLTGNFGSIKYATEEVLVDTASALAGRVIGLSPDTDNHAAYIAHWAAAARADKKEVFRLAAEAQRVADYLLSQIPGMETDPEPNLTEILPEHSAGSRSPQPAV